MHQDAITVAVGAVIRDERGRVLLVKHRLERKGIWEGMWICPGGKLEFGERIIDGIKREVREETNLEIELNAPLAPFERIVREGNRTSAHVVYIDFLATKKSGDLTPGSDVGEAKWVSESQIQDMWNELHEDTQILLKIANIV